jgi:hypothetical protein
MIMKKKNSSLKKLEELINTTNSASCFKEIKNTEKRRWAAIVVNVIKKVGEGNEDIKTLVEFLLEHSRHFKKKEVDEIKEEYIGLCLYFTIDFYTYLLFVYYIV